jgi:PAS domain-containing protein
MIFVARRYREQKQETRRRIVAERRAHELLDEAVATRDRANAANQALRESEARFRSLVEGAPDAILVHAGGCLTYVTPRPAFSWGRTRRTSF